jgi:hypothetical protein
LRSASSLGIPRIAEHGDEGAGAESVAQI